MSGFPETSIAQSRPPEKRKIALKVRFMGQRTRYYVNVNVNKIKREGSDMNENLPCTTSSSLQTFTGALFLLALTLALILVLL